MKNFKTILTGIDTQPILKALEANPELWNQHRFRTSARYLEESEDILLRYQDPSIKNQNWLECVNYPSMFILDPARIFAHLLMFTIKSDRMGRVMITRLKPGHKVNPHKDNTFIPQITDYYYRYHLCLQDNDKTIFRCGDEEFRPNVGDVFWFDNTKEHSVYNNGDTDRLTLIVDLKKITMLNEQAPIETTEEEPIKLSVETSKLNPAYTFQREKVIPIKENGELEPLLHEHWLELALDQDKIKLNPAWEYYKSGDDNLTYQFATIRFHGILVGYYGCTITGHPHYRDSLHCTTDLFWIDPEHRKSGIGTEFYKYIESLLSQLKVKKWLVSFKNHKQHIAFFEYLGFQPTDLAYYKLLS